jgi:PiT family inorganic phosphate transporter
MTVTSFEVLLLVIILGLIFDYTNGFHDAANVVSTVIATKVLVPLTAIVLAAVLNFIGALHTSKVAETITSHLVLPEYTTSLTILCALIGAIVWNIVTWYYGIPSSSSYALVGGLVGASYVFAGKDVIFWNSIVTKVAIPMVLSPIIGFFLAYLLMKFLKFLVEKTRVKKFLWLFSHLQIGSASVVALAHGLSDAQKSMAIITLGLYSAKILTFPIIPFWVIASCALMMALGTASGGFRIIHTIGYKITTLEPVQGFAAETSASCIILLAAFLGMPISSTHMIVGSVAGVGAAKGFKHVYWPITKKLVATWVFTLPGSALAAGTLTYLLT